MQLMSDQQDQFAASIASEAVEVLEDHLLFPGGYLLPLSARGSGVPGMADRPGHGSARCLLSQSAAMYSIDAPNRQMFASLRKRTLLKAS
jgi:hypothetical protein